MRACTICCTICLLGTAVVSLDNGAARKPPMGWSTWNKLRCNFNETVLLDVGQAMKDNGMLQAGYASLNIDECARSARTHAAPPQLHPAYPRCLFFHLPCVGCVASTAMHRSAAGR